MRSCKSGPCCTSGVNARSLGCQSSNIRKASSLSSCQTAQVCFEGGQAQFAAPGSLSRVVILALLYLQVDGGESCPHLDLIAVQASRVCSNQSQEQASVASAAQTRQGSPTKGLIAKSRFVKIPQ